MGEAERWTVDDPEVVEVARASMSHGIEWTGPSSDRYVVLQRIGQGGMGVVLHAYDRKLRREVALKQVKLDRLSQRSENRLIREARAMAQLSHPNVVAIYDVELDAGGVVLVMEYVEGQTLRRWMESQTRPWSEVLAMFRQAARGLAAAHDAGLVHRDFKPSNVLVGNDERARVTDFGLARVALEPGAEASLEGYSGSLDGLSASLEAEDEGGSDLTATGQLLGTLPYMAPEQQRERTADPRADQYAMCVSIWEALCGERPFRGPSAAKYLKAKEAGPPPWPKAIALPRVVIDAIRRGLAPDPDHRWPHVQALMRALNYDPSRRRRRWLVAGGMVGVAVLSVVGAQVWQAQRATRCRGAEEHLAGVWGDAERSLITSGMLSTTVAHAGETAVRVNERLDAYAQGWVAAHTEACEATTVRGEQSGEALDLRMECLARARNSLGAATAVLGRVDDSTIDKSVRVVEELPPLERCGDLTSLRAELPPPEDPDVAAEVERMRTRLAEARSMDVAGQLAPAQQRLEGLLEEAKTLGYDPLTVEVRLHLGRVCRRLGRLDEAEAQLSQALWEALELGHKAVARQAAQRLLFVVGSEKSRSQDAQLLEPLALSLARRPNTPPVDEARVLNTVGEVRRTAGDVEEAESAFLQALAVYERGLGPRSLTVGAVRNNLGALYGSMNRYADAEEQLRLALTARREALGSKHPETALTLNNLAWALQLQDKPKQAEVLFREALEIHESVFGANHWRTSGVLDGLAFSMSSQGELEQAERFARRALKMASDAEDAPPTIEAGFRSRLGWVLEQRGDDDAAEAEYRRALDTALARFPADHPFVGELDKTLGILLLRRTKHAEAEPHLRRALATFEARMPANSPALRPVLLSLARLHRARPALETAFGFYARVLKLDDASDKPPDDHVAAKFEQAQVMWALEVPRPQALELARRALVAAKAPISEEIRAWLAARESAPALGQG